LGFSGITSRKQAEEALRKSEERFRSSLLYSPLPVLLFDDRQQILALIQSWLDQTDYSRGELRCIEDWTARAYGERSGEVMEHIRQIISTEHETERAELTIRTKGGLERVWSLVSCWRSPARPPSASPKTLSSSASRRLRPIETY
jgi:PAS domain S-box-containing protein